METPEDRFYNPARINAWFAVSAVLVMAFTVAVIAADHYDREWKTVQGSFHDLERRIAEETLALRDAPAASLPPGAIAIRNRLLRGDPDASEGAPSADAAAFEAALAAVKGEADFPAGALLAARELAAAYTTLPSRGFRIFPRRGRPPRGSS